jgi:hypothetical protein
MGTEKEEEGDFATGRATLRWTQSHEMMSSHLKTRNEMKGSPKMPRCLRNLKRKGPSTKHATMQQQVKEEVGSRQQQQQQQISSKTLYRVMGASS